MFVDPNRDVNTKIEHVLIESGTINLPDGTTVTEAELAAGETSFHTFCKSLDPNLCFIFALVIANEDEPLFYAVREAALSCGIHCQAGREKPEVMRQQWESYLFAKNHEVDPENRVNEEETAEQEDFDTGDSIQPESEPMESQTISIGTPQGGKNYG